MMSPEFRAAIAVSSGTIPGALSLSYLGLMAMGVAAMVVWGRWGDGKTALAPRAEAKEL